MRGILMIEALYHQVIAGNKTMTRRSSGLELVNENPDEWEYYGWWNIEISPFVIFRDKQHIHPKKCRPRYKVGEVLYLKEPTRDINGLGDVDYTQYAYSTNVAERRTGNKWSNKLFMPACDARAFVKITGIKCERLLDISDNDCIAEGISYYKTEGWKNYDKKQNPNILSFVAPKNSFLSLYRFANKINPKIGTGNPWVWAYTFEYLPNYELKTI
jgi:hypothetical protein